jgi:hypothetical protein
MKSKNASWLGLMALMALTAVSGYSQAPQPPPTVIAPGTPGAAPVNLSPAAAEVVRLVESGSSDDVLTAYIQNSTTLYNLTADQIVYLKDIGISSQVVTAMLNRDSALRNQPGQYVYDQKAYPATIPPPAAQPVPQPVPQPEVPAQPAVPPPDATPPPDYVSNPPQEVNYFYNNLSPYGAWVNLEGIGWCWQPRVVVVNHGWRPYCDGGHWVFTDAGWFWQSDYSWGWAPFHYGRWQMHERCGWVWQPDTVWGPAWVTWRMSGDHCGWAPLPPRATFDVRFGYRFNGVAVGVNFDFGLRPDHFTFIALRDFGDRDLGHRRLPPTEVTKVYNNTTIVNNYIVNNNTIVNRGVPVERVAAVTHTEIKKVAIRDAPAGPGPAVRPGAKNEGVVYRPQLSMPAKAVPMVAQRVDAQHPVVQHQPIVPVRIQQGTAPGRISSPVVVPHNVPAAPAASPAHPGGGRPYYPNQPATPTRQPSASAPVTTPSAQHTVSAPVTTPPSSAQHAAPLKPPAQQANAYTPQTTAQYHPQQTSPARSPSVQQSYSQESNPHVYYPKSYHQANEIHALPQNNPPVSHPSGGQASQHPQVQSQPQHQPQAQNAPGGQQQENKKN